MNHRPAAAILALAATVASGCAPLPGTVIPPLPDSPSLSAVRANPSAYLGRQVRWGGVLASVEMEGERAWVEVVERRLDRYGQPYVEDVSEGRFLARLDGVTDVGALDFGREVTVVGPITGTAPGTVGKRPYDFPVVRAEVRRLWPGYPPYDPFYATPYGYGYGYPPPGYWRYRHRHGYPPYRRRPRR